MRSKPEPPAVPEVVARLRAVLGEGSGDGNVGRPRVDEEADPRREDEPGPDGVEAVFAPDVRRQGEVPAQTTTTESLVSMLRRAARERRPERPHGWLAGRGVLARLRPGGGAVSPVARWQLSSPAARGLTLLLAASLVASVWLVLHSLPRQAAPVVVPTVTTSTAATGRSSATPKPSPVLLVVDVTGPVVHPGIVRVPDGSRVVDVIRAAGGLRRGASAGGLNLARKVVDGEQVVVGAISSPAGTASGSVASGGPLDLNSATVDELDQLPHVGPVLAQRIVDWRDAHGRFSSVDELREVSGIGSRIFAEVSTRVRV